MAHHKRRRPKHQRAGCTYKPHKDERETRAIQGEQGGDARRDAASRAALAEPCVSALPGWGEEVW